MYPVSLWPRSLHFTRLSFSFFALLSHWIVFFPESLLISFDRSAKSDRKGLLGFLFRKACCPRTLLLVIIRQKGAKSFRPGSIVLFEGFPGLFLNGSGANVLRTDFFWFECGYLLQILFLGWIIIRKNYFLYVFSMFGQIKQLESVKVCEVDNF